MRTFAQRQNLSQRRATSDFARRNTVASRSIHSYPTLHLQRTIGNQAVLRLVRQAESNDLEARSGTKEVTRLAPESTHVLQQGSGSLQRVQLRRDDKRRRGKHAKAQCDGLDADVEKLIKLASMWDFYKRNPLACNVNPFWACEDVLQAELVDHGNSMTMKLSETAGRYDHCCEPKLRALERAVLSLNQLAYLAYKRWDLEREWETEFKALENPVKTMYLNLRIAAFEAAETAQSDFEHC